MTRTLNLAGFQIGDSLSLSVSQGALTAGPVNVLSWGGAESGGTIAIVPERTIMGVAPDTVRFTVDLSEADFDTAGPSGDEVYDARMHDLIYIWNFDDAASGNWTAPENVLPEWKNRNVAKGPFVAHMYTSPGTYNPSVLVIEPSSGKTATATLTGDNAIVVEDPNTVYSGANTICINPEGESDFSWAPDETNNVKINLDEITAAALSAYNGGSPKRIALKRGEEYTINFEVGSGWDNMTIAAMGAGTDKAILNVPLTSELVGNRALDLTTSYGDPSLVDFRLADVKFLGDYDPTTTRDLDVADPREAFRSSGSVDMMLSRVEWDGVFRLVGMSGSADRRLHMDDCAATNWGEDYPTYMARDMTGTCVGVMTGCRLSQPGGAHMEGANDCPARWVSLSKIHMRGCDIYFADDGQFCLRLNGTTQRDGNIANIHSMSLEGGQGAIVFAGNLASSASIQRSVVSNAIFDGIIYDGGHTGYRGFDSGSTGLTIRNCLIRMPNTKKQSKSAIKEWVVLQSVGAYDPNVRDAPVNIYNNTFVSFKTPDDNNSQPVDLYRIDGAGTFTDIQWDNNIVHMPEYTPQVENDYAPLTNSPLWNPRNIGWRDAGTMVLSSAEATPTHAIPYDGGTVDFVPGATVTNGSATAIVCRPLGTTAEGNLYVHTLSGTFSDNDSIIAGGGSSGAAVVNGSVNYVGPTKYRPDTGSAVLGAALTGNVSYMDMTLRKRPEPPSIGAWEME